MNETIICAGFGGQGIMLMGKLLAALGMKKGYYVTWMPSYGAEVRGGTAHSMVRISAEKIPSPLVSNPTSSIVMNKPSLLKFINRVKKGGVIIVNTSMVRRVPEKRDIQVVEIPLTKLALDLGNAKCANMIAIGAFINLKKIFSLKEAQDALDEIFPKKDKDMASLNKQALELGYTLLNKK